MTKREFVNRIAVATGYPKTRVDQVVDLFLDELVEVLDRDGRVELRNFGVFKTVELAARVGRNPRTGEAVSIPRSRHVRFRAGKLMRHKLNS